MAHLSAGKEEAYRALAERLSRFPVGVVVNETLMEILKLLYRDDEAFVGSKFPLKPRPLAEIAELAGIPEDKLAPVLDNMAGKGLVVVIPRKNTTYYMLSPVVVGFFEYSLMRADGANLRELSELYNQYFKDRKVAEEIFGSDPKMFRALVYEHYIPELVQSEVLDYEKASAVIRESGGGGLSICACRHKNYHLGKACPYPMEDICTSLGKPAEWLIKQGFARSASVEDLLRNLERSYRLGLVLTCDNVIDEPAYICHCCGCCCGPLQAIKEHGIRAIQPGGFLPQIDAASCLNCESCIDACHVEALEASTGEPALKKEICIGCGVCASTCPSDALQMARQIDFPVPPRNKPAQLIEIAVNRKRF